MQTQLCELVTPATTVGDEPSVSTATDVWCQPRPVSIYFQPTESKYQTWLLLLSLCHHIKGFQKEFLSVLADFDTPPSLGGRTVVKQWFINRIHFPRALLENRSTHEISQNATLMCAAVTKRLMKHDGKKTRMMEHVNTVEFLENLGKRILSATAFQQFQSKKQQDLEDHYVQAPVGVIDEAKLFLATSSNSPSKLSINRGPPPTKLPSKRKRLSPTQRVTPSTSKKAKQTINQQNSVHFVDAIVRRNVSTTSPTRTITTDVPGDSVPSPIKDITFINTCRDNIRMGFAQRSFNFNNSLRAYRLHHSQTDPIQIDDSVNNGWLYPCTEGNCKSEGFVFVPNRKIRKDRPQLCQGCLLPKRKDARNDNDRKRRANFISRISPITSMNDDEKNQAYRTKQVKVHRFKQANKRLREQLERKSTLMTLENVTDASSMIMNVYEFLKSKKLEATKVILDAVIDMQTSKRIPVEDEKRRSEYVDFIASEISNTCKLFTGKNSQIRFHPVMINLAMNLYMGMNYEDGTDNAPFVFPTVKTLQRHRALVATHEGTDPKVYARVSEMEGFSSETDLLIHWMFDEVNLTSGVMWNATNDDLRGLCCGTTGDVEDLKDLLEDLYDTGSNDMAGDEGEGRDGIYCNQWLARNPYGTTLVGEFFYNEGNLDGNEIMRQFLQVSTSAALANLTTVGLVSDMGGSNDRFYHYLRDGESIPASLLWPTDHVTCLNPVNPDVNLHTWSCSTHGLKNVRSQMEMSRRDGSGSRQFLTAEGDNFGWWVVRDAYNRDKERELKKGGNFRTSLSAQSVELDSFSKMNA